MKKHNLLLFVLFFNLISCGKEDFFVIKDDDTTPNELIHPLDDGDINKNYIYINDEFIQKENKSIDILWVMDNSGSMKDEQTNLANSFERFINNFIKKEINFKMAITTTDASSTSKKGKEIGDFNQMTLKKSQESSSTFIEYFQEKINVGTGGSRKESGLSTSLAFLENYKSVFIRPNALLTIIYVSDEDDQSSETVPTIINKIKALKSDAHLFKAYSITAFKETKQSHEYVGTRYQEATALTLDGGYNADINKDFHTTLEKIGENMANAVTRFPLSKPPAEIKLVKIYVNTKLKELNTHYSYDETNHSIQFIGNYVPAVLDKIKIVYPVVKL